MLLCTVRTCHLPLTREARRVVCAHGHSFDIARSGYVNLLQPQDRRSANPGDSAQAVAARRRFLDRGFTQSLTESLVEAIGSRGGAERLLDVGCGDGTFLAAAALRGFEVHGVDLSVPAIDLAAKRLPAATLVVANADRFIPWSDHSIDVITSITARVNRDEFLRVLRASGLLVIALPAPDDLIELRESVQGEAIERDRTVRTIDELRPSFQLIESRRIVEEATLDREAIHDVMASSYRGMRRRERERLEALDSLAVTFSRDVLLFSA